MTDRIAFGEVVGSLPPYGGWLAFAALWVLALACEARWTSRRQEPTDDSP